MVDAAGQIGSSVGSLMKEYNSIALNLANVNTSGYKRRINSFSREMMDGEGSSSDSVSGGEISANGAIDFSQGSLLRTGRVLDVAISGKGFFVIETKEGPLYSRNGVFQVSKTGQLVDLEGRNVAGEDGPIVIPGSVSVQQVNVAEDGSVTVGEAVLGKLKMVEFKEDADQLIPAGKNCYLAPEELRPTTAEKVMLKQGFRENSNVTLVEELVNLVTVTRLYETNMKILSRKRDNNKVMIGVANG